MDNKFKEVRRKIFNKKNIIKSFFMLSLIIYISLIYISQKNVSSFVIFAEIV